MLPAKFLEVLPLPSLEPYMFPNHWQSYALSMTNGQGWYGIRDTVKWDNYFVLLYPLSSSWTSVHHSRNHHQSYCFHCCIHLQPTNRDTFHINTCIYSHSVTDTAFTSTALVCIVLCVHLHLILSGWEEELYYQETILKNFNCFYRYNRLEVSQRKRDVFASRLLY